MAKNTKEVKKEQVKTNSEVLTGTIIDGKFNSVSYICLDGVGENFTLHAGKDATPKELKIWFEAYYPQAQDDADFARYVKSYSPGEEKTHEAALENIGTAPSAEEETFTEPNDDAATKKELHEKNIRRADRTLRKLPKEQRIIIRERYMKPNPTPYRQIAPLIGKSEATVRRWETKAMTAIKEQMPAVSEQEIQSSLHFIYRDDD